MNEAEYGQMYHAEDRHWWYVALHELVTSIARQEYAAKGPLRILDAGCGTGRLCQLLAPYGQVEGFDASETALEFCRARDVDACLADLNTAELGENRYDLITSIDVLYHAAIQDEAPILARFFRALKPGGVLVLNLVAFEFLRSTHDIAVHTRRRYTIPELLLLLEQAGFTVEKATYRLGFLFLPIALYRLLRRILPHADRHEDVASDVVLPNPVINRLLLALMRLENRLLRHVDLPVGTSLFVVARRSL